MSQKETKYILTSKNDDGIGVIHKQAICHIAFATALDALGVSEYFDSAQTVRKFAAKKTQMTTDENGLSLDIQVPVKRELNMYQQLEKAQKEIIQGFSDFLSIDIKHINLVVDQVLV